MKKNGLCCFPMWGNYKKALRIMKLTTVLLLVFVFQTFAVVGYAQRAQLTLDMKNISVEDALYEIEQQSDYVFLYNRDLIDVSRKSNLKVKNAKIETVLQQLFEGSGVGYQVIDRQVVLSIKDVQQQKRTVSGKVTDGQGAALPGVAIILKGTTNGTITDFEGNYSLSNVTDEDVLVFSFVGMKSQEIIVGDQSNIEVVMEDDAIGIEEVVAVGYGTQKKADLTGAISTVKGENLAKAPIPNLSAALGGKVTGVLTTQTSGQPGYDGTTFRIRGNSTTGNNDPLVIVDGVVRSFSRIDPNDIESLTVLKDAASTAVYGARAANGVLLITTKRGKSGKASFNYSGSYGVQRQTRKTELMNAYEYAKYINEAKANFEQQPLFPEDQIAKYKSGELPSYEWLGSVLANSAPMQKHNLSVSGGTKKVNYFLGYGYLDQSGFYSTSKYKQNNVRSNLDVQLNERLKVSVDLSGRIEDRQKSPNTDGHIYQGTLFGRPYLNPLLDTEVEPGALGFNGMNGSPKGAAERSGFDNQLDYVFESNFQFEYDIPFISGLIAKGMYSFDYTSRKDKVFKRPYTAYVLNESTGDYIETMSGFSTVSLTEERRSYKQVTTQLSLNYLKKVSQHTFSALVLFEQIESNDNFLQAFRDNYITTSLPELFAGGTDLWSNDGFTTETARRGYIGRFDYDFGGKYLLQANMRIDQSFNFPKEGRNGFFPAFSAGWRLSEEPFMSDVSFISNLKLRGSWGKTGNDRVDPFQYLSTFEFEGGTVIGGSYQKGIDDPLAPNFGITWETATTTDFGFDLGLFDNKLNVEFDYFYKRTEDILQPNDGIVPDTFGKQLPDLNIGIVDSWGTEGLVRYTNRFGELRLTAEANFSWFDNEAIFVSESETILPAIAQTGRSLNLRHGYLSDGLFQTQDEIDNAPTQFSSSIHDGLRPGDIRYKDINGRDENGNLTGKPDGKINADDRAVIGSSGDPNLVFGFNLGMEYKGFDLSANFQGASDFSRVIRPIPFERDGNTYRELIDSWRPGNEDARYPRLSSGDLPANNAYDSDFWVTEVSYLRLRNMELGYNFSSFKSYLSKIGVENIRLFLAGTNLLTFSNLDWRDPEGESGPNPFYPQVKTYSIGVNVNF